MQDEKKDEDGNYTVSVKVEPSDVFQTLQQSSAEVSKEKIAQGMKETDPGVFASVLTESVQKSIDKNSYGDPVTVTVKVEKNHSGTYELSETERSKLETAMFPTHNIAVPKITIYFCNLFILSSSCFYFTKKSTNFSAFAGSLNLYSFPS